MAYIGNQIYQVAFVTDTFSGNGSTTVFTMSVAPANTSSVLIAVSGVLQDPSTYSVSGTTLTFSAAPPTGTSNISARYLGIPASGITTTAYRTVTEFTATSGQTTFTPPSYTVGFINVYRNGVLLGSADYTATNGTTVVLAIGAITNDLVVIESFYVSSVLNAIPATAGAVNSTYIADNAITTAKIAAGAVVQADLANGIAGTGPAFSAYLNSNQSISSGVWTKIAFNTKEFDTASCYDNATNYRFIPNVAGYYQFNFSGASLNTASQFAIKLYKNGSAFAAGGNIIGSQYGITGSSLISMNGTTDYVEIYMYITGTTPSIPGGVEISKFSGFLARAA